jgi:excisionase family DNA binding protein
VNDDDRLMVVAEVAEYLRLPESTTYRLIKAGTIPAMVLSPRRIRVRRADLDRWLAERTTGGAS